MAALQYRSAVSADAAECVELRGQTRENAISAATLASLGITVRSWANDIEAGRIPGHVCIDEDRIVGYCFGDKQTGEIVVLAVLPQFEGRGIGKALLLRVVKDLRCLGHRRLFLACSSDSSHRSYGFYRHLRWRSTGSFDANDDEVLELQLPDERLVSDVPSPIDLRLMTDASEWEATAIEKRPWRTEFFAKFVSELANLKPVPVRILELGSGPGFLADKVLSGISSVRMTLLDFSEPMHALARRRVGSMKNRVEFLARSFKEPEWVQGLAGFDAAITNQAVHELRHKRYAVELHRQVATVLRPAGTYLVCDHFYGPEGMTNDQLYMTPAEQKSAIEAAGFRSVVQVLLKGGMVLHRATAP